MARFSGKVGYGESVEIRPGVWDELIIERSYFGDVILNNRRLTEGDEVNGKLSLNNSISIVADAHAFEHFSAIRYVEWAGVLWLVTNVMIQNPRLILQLGEVYRGPTP